MFGGRRWNPKGRLNPAFKGGLVTEADWFRERYESGLPLRQIAVEANCSLRTAARWAVTHNIQLRASGSNPKPQGVKNPLWRGGPPVCPCGRLLSYKTRSRVAKGNLLCQKCEFSSRSGQNHPNWAGRADIMGLIRGHSRRTWLPRVLERDGFRCLICASTLSLTAHHIWRLEAIVSHLLRDAPLESSEERLKAVTLLRNSFEVNDVSNGATLCKECHSKIHRGKRSDVVTIYADGSV